jgi:integrase
MANGNRLTARQVANAKPGKGRKAAMLSDGGNLFLQLTTGNDSRIRRSWIFKYELDGTRHEMGLGPCADVSLSEARGKARERRKELLDGVDPLAIKHQQQQQRRFETAKAVSFAQCAEAYLEAHEAGWSNAKHRDQWRATLTKQCRALSDIPVKDIDTDCVLRILTPLWSTIPVTAGRIRNRIERVLAWAKSRGLRDGDNPARWKDHLSLMLVSPKKVRKVKHHSALPFAELPLFVQELRQKNLLSARALEFTILCATRTSETIDAVRSEFDLDSKVWIIPAARMKGGRREHRIPLSNRAIEILQQCPGDKPFAAMHHQTMWELVNRLRPGLTAHGFRSSFADWAAETTNFPNHVVEMALAHSIGNAVEASYRRGDLFEKRKRLMQAWADFCGRPATGATVTPMRRPADA